MEDIRNFQYFLIPGKCPDRAEYIQLHNQAYQYWRDFWEKFFLENKQPPMGYKKDDFLRQDMVAIIMYEKQIVSMHLYTQFNVRSFASVEHSYFVRSFNEGFLNKLKDRKVESVMSLEWLTVDPVWRKRKQNQRFSFALTHIVLACYLQLALNIDANIAISRNDLKVTQAGIDLGWDVVESQIPMHGFNCDLVALFNGNLKPHPIKEVNEAADYLWKNRIDFTNLTSNLEPIRKLKAA